MKCPSCAQTIDAPLPRCPHCKLSLHKLDARFGLVPAHSRLLSDRSATLSVPQMKQLRERLRLFQRKFPQSIFSVFVTELPPATPVNEFAFWMANRAHFTSVEKTRGENRDLLLVIDVANNAAALTAGYGLEQFVTEELMQKVLADFVSAYHANGLAAAIDATIDSIVDELRELAGRIRKNAGAKEETDAITI